jgi:hypothetical protein
MSSRSLIELTTLAVLVGAASSAGAANVYTFTGKFAAAHGHFVAAPIAGNTPCPSLLLRSGPGGAKIPAAMTPPSRTMTRPAAPFGCVKGKGKVTTTGMGVGVGAGFVLAPNGFSAPPRGATTAVGIMEGRFVQLATSFGVSGPPASRTRPPAGTMFTGKNAAAFRAFKKSAWKSQTGRAGATFTWCFGNPNCTAVTQGKRPLIVRYRPGPNKFGGTMALLRSSGSRPSSVALTVGSGTFLLVPGFAGTSSQPTGRGYAERLDNKLSALGLWGRFMVGSVTRPIVGKQKLVTQVMTFFPQMIPLTEYRYGFPFTTGTVLVRQTGQNGTFGVDIVTLTARGGDSVTAMGARNLSLVAGGVADWRGSLGREPILAQMALPEPGATVQLLAAVAGLLAIAAWRAVRIR